MIAPQFVKANKTDRADAEAICEAVRRPSMRYVRIKTVQQQNQQAIHRIRRLAVGQRTAQANQIRGLLAEYGIEIAQGRHHVRKQGVFISASGVRSVWLRHGLENFKLRLKALEARAREEGLVLTEAQVAALEKKKHDDAACGEIETAHPGYLGSQDTFYVGILKGVGRVYQQTFVDTYSKVEHAKLYTTRTPITVAHLHFLSPETSSQNGTTIGYNWPSLGLFSVI